MGDAREIRNFSPSNPRKSANRRRAQDIYIQRLPSPGTAIS